MKGWFLTDDSGCLKEIGFNEDAIIKTLRLKSGQDKLISIHKFLSSLNFNTIVIHSSKDKGIRSIETSTSKRSTNACAIGSTVPVGTHSLPMTPWSITKSFLSEENSELLQ